MAHIVRATILKKVILTLLWLLNILKMTILKILHYCGNLEERSVILLSENENSSLYADVIKTVMHP